MAEYIIVNGELYHHGIKGMRWGVRRFQYTNGRLTAAGKKRYLDGWHKPTKVKASVKRAKQADTEDEENETQEKKGLTDKQKKAIIVGAAAVGTGLAIYGGYKLSKMYKGTGQAIDPETGFRLLDKNQSDADILKNVNPGRVSIFSTYKNKEIINGSSYNCMLCTTSYDLRKRGYDVHAGLSTNGYMPDELFSKIYKNYNGTTKIDPPRLTFSNADKAANETLHNIEQNLLKHGSGSRGNIVVWWKGNGGHSMIWENIDGKIVFKDGQTNQVYKDFAKEILSNASTSKPVELLRTDNLDINLSEMKNVINSDTIFKTYVDHGAEITARVASDPVVQLAATGAAYGGATIYSRKKQKQEGVTNNARKKRS